MDEIILSKPVGETRKELNQSLQKNTHTHTLQGVGRDGEMKEPGATGEGGGAQTARWGGGGGVVECAEEGRTL